MHSSEVKQLKYKMSFDLVGKRMFPMWEQMKFNEAWKRATVTPKAEEETEDQPSTSEEVTEGAVGGRELRGRSQSEVVSEDLFGSEDSYVPGGKDDFETLQEVFRGMEGDDDVFEPSDGQSVREVKTTTETVCEGVMKMHPTSK